MFSAPVLFAPTHPSQRRCNDRQQWRRQLRQLFSVAHNLRRRGIDVSYYYMVI
jgi:hypothetical protein